MKFSWQLLNTFINLNHIKFNEFQDQLTLSGLEIENINKNFIEISITANRKEVSSILSLARETSIIFNSPLKILPINTIKNTNYTRIVTLEKNYIKKTPQWLLSELDPDNIENNDILINIQRYIKIKWGETFEIKNNDTQEYKQQANRINKESQIIVFTKILNKKSAKYHINEFYENMYIDSIKLISTFTKLNIGKYTEKKSKVLAINKRIKIKKENINTLLGNMNEKNFKFIETNTIKNILKRLNLYPEYKKLEKAFIVQVPNYRKHDLKREIDIIEEIGRIYKFQNFFNKITKYNLKGFQSNNFVKTKQIRHTLQNLGFHEVVNCGLTNNTNNFHENIKLYNPINNEQKELKNNILESIIKNYEENIKNSKKNIEIFEISKIFERDKHQYNERQKLGGLIYNINYTRNTWENKSEKITLFHFKDIIEIFLQRINSTAILQKILSFDDTKNIKNTNHLFNTNKRLGLYNIKNNKIIGIVGELNTNIITSNKNTNIYIFEINLEELIETISSKNHLQYVIKKYSNYPSITRDISIKLKMYINIKEIKSSLIKNNHSLIESIEILNEYKLINNYRSISLRITYRSKFKTLTKEEIKFIDQNLEKKIQKLEQFQQINNV
uniref:phenylalanine--tRNA ligase n=1 Tax=Herposiphonia versicolor TaxID=2007163 RepID=A0A1Z1MG80_9FLOR|nr:Phenylalanine-tRNA ligase beta subunit [Herposiphonia versicolor]ARW64862.1 Phenylalanine-tRNA ligase beta subunit [Herposiphonia versicolor]